jgi:hypothetical protein
LETVLNIASGNVHQARAAAGACACTLSAAGAAIAKKLTLREAAISDDCPCVPTELDNDMRRAYILWLQAELEAIADGRNELCQGETGSLFPAVGQIERQLDEWSEVVVQDNADLRDQ